MATPQQEARLAASAWTRWTVRAPHTLISTAKSHSIRTASKKDWTQNLENDTCPSCRGPVHLWDPFDHLAAPDFPIVDLALNADDTVTSIIAPKFEDFEPDEQPDRRTEAEKSKEHFDSESVALNYWTARAAKKSLLSATAFYNNPGFRAQERYHDACIAAERLYQTGLNKACSVFQEVIDATSSSTSKKLVVEQYRTTHDLWDHSQGRVIAAENNSIDDNKLKELNAVYPPNEPRQLRARLAQDKVALTEVLLSERKGNRWDFFDHVLTVQASYGQALDEARARLEEARDDAGVSAKLWEGDPPDPREVPMTREGSRTSENEDAALLARERGRPRGGDGATGDGELPGKSDDEEDD